jgi:hypothetical protein
MILIRRSRVSNFLADSIQQIHSLRASGVISCQTSYIGFSAWRIFRKSSGILCIVPADIVFEVIVLVMTGFYQILSIIAFIFLTLFPI